MALLETYGKPKNQEANFFGTAIIRNNIFQLTAYHPEYDPSLPLSIVIA